MSVNDSADDLSSGSDAPCVAAATAQRVRNPQGQGGRLRAELIAAADGILARTGDVEGLSLRAVARAVGIATPSIYLHFADKRALVKAVLEARFAELTAAITTAVLATPNPADRLKAGCMAYCRFATEHPNAYKVLFGRTPSAPAGSESGVVIDHRATTFGVLEQGIAGCMRAGLAPPGDPTRIATSVWTAMHGIVSLRGSLPDFPWPPLDQQLDDLLGAFVRLRHNPPVSSG